MYKRDIYTVLENKNIAKDVYRMVLEGDTSFITAPGQFINIEIFRDFIFKDYFVTLEI